MQAFKSDTARAAVLASYEAMLSRWPVPYESRLVSTQAGMTHVVISGRREAPPLLLLHGGGGNATMWFANVGELSQHFRTYAIDTIGDMGRSAETRPVPSSDGYAQWLDQTMDALNLARAHICGASHGGWLASRFAISYPQRVDGLVLLAPAFLTRMRPQFLLYGVLAAVVPARWVVTRFFRYMTSRHAHPVPPWAMEDLVVRAQANRLNAQAVPTLTDENLRSLPRQTLLLLGADDPIYDIPATAAQVAATAPGVRIAIVPDAGHVMAVEQPERVNAHILAFLAESAAACA